MVRSEGRVVVASRCSSRNETRLPAAHSSSPATRQRAVACSVVIADSSRVNSPIARPSSAGRPSWSPFQNGSRPGWPGAGETSTRSWVMSSMRQEVAPSAKTSPTRDS